MCVGTSLTYAMHIVYDEHHCTQHTSFIVYIVKYCHMGWQAGRVLTLSLPGSVYCTIPCI
jgi:hypothetical protein